MPTYEEARRLADAFDKAYPKTLPGRLKWLCEVLGINRPRLLRIMGLSEAEVEGLKNKSWKTILSQKNLEDTGWGIEGHFHQLLTFFGYDWKELAEYIRHLKDTSREELTPSTPQTPIMAILPCLTNGGGPTFLFQQLALGGPQSVLALLLYLSEESSAHDIPS